MKHFLLFYEVGENFLERRAPFRREHLSKAWAAQERGELVLGGALTDPVDGAVLVFAGDSPKAAEKFAREDPYVVNGIIKSWKVREWLTAVGEAAVMPVRPEEV